MIKTHGLYAQMRAVLNGGDVRRFHTYRMLRENTVAQHSFHVAWWCALIWELQPSANLLLHALRHDLAEYYVGDLPTTVKRAYPDIDAKFHALETTILTRCLPLPALAIDEQITLDVADKLDGAAFAAIDYMYGNIGSSAIAERGALRAREIATQLTSDNLRANAYALTDCVLELNKIPKEHPEDEFKSE